MANKGIKAPSAKQLRMMSALSQFLGGKELKSFANHVLDSVFKYKAFSKSVRIPIHKMLSITYEVSCFTYFEIQ